MPLIVDGRWAQCPGLSFSCPHRREEGGPHLICLAGGSFELGGKTGPAAFCQGLEAPGATRATTGKDVPDREPGTPRSTRAFPRQTHKYIHGMTKKVFIRPWAEGGGLSCDQKKKKSYEREKQRIGGYGRVFGYRRLFVPSADCSSA